MSNLQPTNAPAEQAQTVSAELPAEIEKFKKAHVYISLNCDGHILDFVGGLVWDDTYKELILTAYQYLPDEHNPLKEARK